jgi:uncharacterized protein (TIGR03435 family)
VDEKHLSQSTRGKVTARRQPLTKLSRFLTTALELPIVDETGLSGKYNWELPYQPGQPEVTIQAVRDRLGLELVKARRSIKMLVAKQPKLIKIHTFPVQWRVLPKVTLLPMFVNEQGETTL